MLRLYGQKSDFTVCDQSKSFRKAVFGLCWFHTILIERKKFKSLGWNVTYAFNGKPYDEQYDKKASIPWLAIQYLIAEANYGGRVTDDRDRRLICVYAKEIFNDNLIAPERWRPYGTEEMNYMYSADEQNIKHP